MFEHFQLLSFLIILYSSIWVISYLKQVHKSFPDKVIKAIIIYSFWFILLETIQFIIIYIRVNFDSGELSNCIDCLNFTLYIGLMLSFYLMINILLNFHGKSFNRSQHKWLILLVVFIIISFIIKTIIPESQKLFTWVDYINLNIYSLIRITIYIEGIILIGFYFFWEKSKQNIERIKIGKSFSLLFFIANCLPSILYHLLRNIITPQIYDWIIPFSINFTFILITFLWTKFVYLNYAKKKSKLISEKDKFKPIYTKYKISRRETEIIELLIDGKSSKDIIETLFLSHHTVKNHITHIYSKLNVKSRYELIHFFFKYNKL